MILHGSVSIAIITLCNQTTFMNETTNTYKITAANKNRCRSCIMLEEQQYLERFRKLGIEEIFTNKDGVLVVDIPTENIDDFVKLYCKVMRPGRWNEYIGPRSGFYFKMPSGETRHIILNTTNEPLINKTIKEFIPSWKPKHGIWKWLASIDIYADWLHSV